MTETDRLLTDLEPSERKLVEAAALAGRPVPIDVAAALLDASPDEAVDIGEAMIEAGLLGDSPVGLVSTEPERIAAGLSAVRMAYLYGELARAFIAAGYAERTPGLLGRYLLKAGDPAAAVEFIAAASTSGGEVIDLIDAGVVAIEDEGVGTSDAQGRLRLERAKYYQTAGRPDLAADDLRTSVRLLRGEARVDALGFLAAVEDNRQQPQTAEVYAAAGIAEAIAIEEPIKAASLLLLQARILNRIGFPSEADASLTNGVGVLQELGNPYQRFLVTDNMARIALDRGRAVRADSLFDRVFTTAEQAAGLAAQADAAAWLARAQFLRGRPSEGLESVETAMELAGVTETAGPIFLGHMAHAEGAGRFAAYQEALAAADAMLGVVMQQIPEWENAARYLRGRALFGQGRVEEAAEEVERSLQLTPRGINGWRWRLRIEAFGLSVLAAQEAEWPRDRAEDLTDELLQGQSLDVAAELMAVRARVEKDPALARQAAALALQLGIPTTAAVAIDAGGLWSDPVAAPVASHIKETARFVPEAWRDAWLAQPEIAAALAAPDVVDEELTAAAATLQADLDVAMAAAGLAEPGAALSPAQRRAEGLVRRRRRSRRARWAIPAVVAILGLAAVLFVLFGPKSLEETNLTNLPEVFTGHWATLGGSADRAGVTDRSGVVKPEGYFWRNADNQGQYHAPVTVIGPKVVVGGLDGQLYIFDRRGDEQLDLTTGTGGRIDDAVSGVNVSDVDLAIVPTGDGRLRAFDLTDGTEVWNEPFDTCCTVGVDEANGRVYVGGSDGVFYALDLRGGLVGSWPEDGVARHGPITTAVTLGGGKAYYGAGSELWQVDLQTGTLVQCDVPTSGAFVTPVVVGGTVYAANAEQFVYLFDTEGCDLIDNLFLQEDLSVKPAVHDGIVYQPGVRGVYAYDSNEADQELRRLWGPFPVRDGQLLAPVVKGSPVVAGGLVYFGAQDGYVYALDADTGELVWEWNEDGAIISSPAVTDGVIYVATTDGQVIAIGGEEGVSMQLPTTTAPPTTAPSAEQGSGAG